MSLTLTACFRGWLRRSSHLKRCCGLSLAMLHLLRPSSLAAEPCCGCSDSYVALSIPVQTTFTDNSVIQGTILLRKNKILVETTFNNQPTWVPLKRWCNTQLLFYRKPSPSQPLGGWVPSRLASDPILLNWLSCNDLPLLSYSERQEIISLFLPCCEGTCCR